MRSLLVNGSLLVIAGMGTIGGLLLTVAATIIAAVPAGLYLLALFLFWKRS